MLPIPQCLASDETGDGLLINVADRGTPVSPAAREYLGAVTTLASTDGQTLGTAHSGFA